MQMIMGKMIAAGMRQKADRQLRSDTKKEEAVSDETGFKTLADFQNDPRYKYSLKHRITDYAEQLRASIRRNR